MKDSLLFAEGFIGAAGSMVSETAIGAVDLTQIIGIASIDGVNRLTGGQTPEWMKRDLQGTADNLSSLAELGVGTYTALTDPGAAQRGQDPNASYADKAAYRAQQTGKALWDKVTHMDAYDAGGLTFEIASLFVGPAAVGKMAKGTKLGAKAAEMIQLAKNSTKARILANVEKWGSRYKKKGELGCTNSHIDEETLQTAFLMAMHELSVHRQECEMKWQKSIEIGTPLERYKALLLQEALGDNSNEFNPEWMVGLLEKIDVGEQVVVRFVDGTDVTF